MSTSLFSDNGKYKPSTRTFLLGVLYVAGGALIGDICYYLCFPNEKIDIASVFMWILFCSLIVVSYFFSSWMAYRSNLLPTVKNRENVHIISFTFLSFLIIIGFILSSYI